MPTNPWDKPTTTEPKPPSVETPSAEAKEINSDTKLFFDPAKFLVVVNSLMPEGQTFSLQNLMDGLVDRRDWVDQMGAYRRHTIKFDKAKGKFILKEGYQSEQGGKPDLDDTRTDDVIGCYNEDEFTLEELLQKIKDVAASLR